MPPAYRQQRWKRTDLDVAGLTAWAGLDAAGPPAACSGASSPIRPPSDRCRQFDGASCMPPHLQHARRFAGVVTAALDTVDSLPPAQTVPEIAPAGWHARRPARRHGGGCRRPRLHQSPGHLAHPMPPGSTSAERTPLSRCAISPR